MYKFLLVEDSKEDAEACTETITRMNHEFGEERISVVVSRTLESALGELNKSYNGVIVDIQLDGDNSGNTIIRTIIDNYRVPVAIMTGTPDTELEEDSPIHVYKKGESTYEDIINQLIKSFSTGLFNVLGGTGIIENVMNKVFWDNLYPQIRIWEGLYVSGIDTEKVLLRYAIGHMQELIDDEIPSYVTEEMYIKPPINDYIRTGSIISSREGLICIVLSPPCDLALRDGTMKTDRILLCEIDDQETVNGKVIEQVTKLSKKKDKLKDAIKNNYTEYYHWLPRNSLFDGGYINFRKVLTYSPEQLAEQFNKPVLKVQEFFVKSILARFSSYYARQGQPDFDFQAEVESIMEGLPQAVTQLGEVKSLGG